MACIATFVMVKLRITLNVAHNRPNSKVISNRRIVSVNSDRKMCTILVYLPEFNYLLFGIWHFPEETPNRFELVAEFECSQTRNECSNTVSQSVNTILCCKYDIPRPTVRIFGRYIQALQHRHALSVYPHFVGRLLFIYSHYCSFSLNIQNLRTDYFPNIWLATAQVQTLWC